MATAPQSFVPGEPLYEARFAITGIGEYGYSLEALFSGTAPPPPGGARFDVVFEGALEGPRLSGTAAGTDYARVRGDGRMDLHIHLRIATPDGAAVAFFGGGVAVPDPATGLLRLYINAALHSSDPRYAWVNGLPVWTTGTADLARREIRVTGYTPAAGG